MRASALEHIETPDYKVAFFAFDCYHMQDENGKRTGYGYEMMQGISKYLQCTFSYVGHGKSAEESVEMLRRGEVDLYTAARRTREREEEFAFSAHPSITSFTYMNVKVGNQKIVSGDYSTYNGIRVGLLRRHTYNSTFLSFVQDKGFDCEIVYYDTPTELSNALINDEVDALVNSYIRIPEDERTVENFGETPYYIMARKEDQALLDQIDEAIDCMNLETPNWRTELCNYYYGSQKDERRLTGEEQALLKDLLNSGEVIRAVMNPGASPYSWYENGEAHGIVADIFRATAEELGLNYEIVPVRTKEEYEAAIASGDVDIWMDQSGCYEDEGEVKYKLTDPYLTTTMSVLRIQGSSDKIERLVTDDDHILLREIISAVWPETEFTVVDSLQECSKRILSGEADGALLMSYTAQELAQDDMQNRLRVDIVPGALLELKMGVNANDSCHFYGLWKKTLADVAESVSAEIVQGYLEQTITPTLLEYMFDHSAYLLALCFGVFFLLMLMILLYLQSVKSRNRQKKISEELAVALKRAEEATAAKQNFFSKMSHDIRTPLNVVLGMTQVAWKYRDDTNRLESALGSITTEGNYLLMLINSILDVNQLEHGAIELARNVFDPTDCVAESAELLRPLAGKKEQQLTVQADRGERVVVGDANRLKQIIINILSNAIKYTDDGGHIELRLEYLSEQRCRFICKDDGIGMTPEFVQHVCDDYARAEDSRVSKIQGTGLGMSVVKGFTELMGGTLRIESELGKGSVFTIEIPFPDASAEQCEAVLHPLAEVSADEKRYVGKKVLLVEDNALNAEIAIELLQGTGLTVDWAENGKTGVERFEASGPNEYFAVFMDMQMPVMDGVAATEHIRGSGRSDSNVPIFAVTANAFANDRRRCCEAGMNGYIAKPVSAKNIVEILGRIGAEGAAQKDHE